MSDTPESGPVDEFFSALGRGKSESDSVGWSPFTPWDPDQYDPDSVDADEFDAVPESERPMPPDELAARILVHDWASSGNEHVQTCAVPGNIVILRVPERWVTRVTGAWVDRFFPLPYAAPGDDEAKKHRTKAASNRPFPVTRTRDYQNLGDALRDSSGGRFGDTVDRSLREGRGLLCVFESDMDSTQQIEEASDAVAVLHPLTPDQLKSVCEITCGTDCHELLSTKEASGVIPDTLLFALRPNATADDYARRIRRLVRAREYMEPEKSSSKGDDAGNWTIDSLPMNDDVAVWARQTVTDLRALAAGDLDWRDVDRGVLLSGPPGTGKTSLAKAVAKSVGLPIFVGSYSIFESGRDGRSDYHVLLKNLRKFFADAKAAAPSIAFLDEVDSFVARGHAGHNESWYRPIMNSLLAELDGATARDGVFVIAATNNSADIDDALRRPGRLDREIYVGLPDAPTLSRILAAHLPEIDAADFSRCGVAGLGGSGADAEQWCRSARRAARVARRPVTVSDLETAICGTDSRSLEHRRRVAVHEAGHALVAEVMRPGSVVSVSIRKQGSEDGGTETKIGGGLGSKTEREASDLITWAMAGRAAEILTFGDFSLGSGGFASSDLAMATSIAVALEASCGVNHLIWRGETGPAEVPGMLIANRGLDVVAEARIRRALAAAIEICRSNQRIPPMRAVFCCLGLLGEHIRLRSVMVGSVHEPEDGHKFECAAAV